MENTGDTIQMSLEFPPDGKEVRTAVAVLDRDLEQDVATLRQQSEESQLQHQAEKEELQARIRKLEANLIGEEERRDKVELEQDDVDQDVQVERQHDQPSTVVAPAMAAPVQWDRNPDWFSDEEEEWVSEEPSIEAARAVAVQCDNSPPFESVPPNTPVNAGCSQWDRAPSAAVEKIVSVQHASSPEVVADPTVPAVNDWTKSNLDTVRKWQKDIEKSSFIYGELLDKAETNVERVLVVSLLLSTTITLISTLSVTLGLLEHPWVVFAFNIYAAVAGAVIMLGTGFLKIKGWDHTVKHLTKFVEKLDSNWFVFETELSIPPDQRQNAKDFIKRADGLYMYLMQQCPPISGVNYTEANQKYQKRLFGNYVWQQKFKKQVQAELREIKVD